jgi:hypothetical protein
MDHISNMVVDNSNYWFSDWTHLDIFITT